MPVVTVRHVVALAGLALAVACSSTVVAQHAGAPSPSLRPASATSTSTPPPPLGRLVHLPSGRSYWFSAAAGPGRRPVVLVLHGLYLTPQNVAAQTRILGWAKQHDVAVAFPVGLHLSWAAGPRCCGYAAGQHVDDVRFLTAVVADVERTSAVDRRRVAVMGDSLGGMMALRAACAAPATFRLGAAVGGPLLVHCAAGNLIRVRGAHDRTVPAEGGYDTYLHATLPSLAQERALLGAHAHERVVVWGGGHAWPRRADGLDATDLIGTALLR